MKNLLSPLLLEGMYATRVITICHSRHVAELLIGNGHKASFLA